MTLSTRTFVFDREGRLYRFPAARYVEMLSSPQALRIPAFASQRVRAAEATVELVDRLPSQIMRLVFYMLEFDAAGVAQADQLMQQTAAAIDIGLGERGAKDVVVDAASRFIVRGGRWKPTPALEKTLIAAALGELKCELVHFA